MVTTALLALTVRPVFVPQSQANPAEVMVIALDPSVSVRVFVLLLLKIPHEQAYPAVFSVPVVSVTVPVVVVFRPEVRTNVPAPLKVTLL